jgi:multiple sugar transport system substrate-binding protein
MIRAMNAYTEIWPKGCTPPDSVTWTDLSNNKAFLTQTVVMTLNGTLSIPGALKRERPDDYNRNAATIDWPQAVNGEPLTSAVTCTGPRSSKMAAMMPPPSSSSASSPRRAG